MGNICCSSNFYETRVPTLMRGKIVNGVRVLILQGEIENLKADVLFNHSNSRLEIQGGISAQLINAAGSDVKKQMNDYIDTNGHQPAGDIAVTGGGDLQCSSLVHLICPMGRGDTTGQALMRESLEKALQW